MSDVNRGFDTRQIHAGPGVAHAVPRATPIHLTAGFPFADFAQAESHFQQGTGFGYTRIGNPTIDAVERRLAEIEGGTQALLVASGQAALTVAILAVAGAGDHIVSSNHIYEGSRGLFNDVLTRLGIETSYVQDAHNLDAWEAQIRPNTVALFGETISNAANHILDVRAIADLGNRHGIPLIIDSTFSTPFLSQPLQQGAALVMHSASKFLSGHGSVIGGVVVDAGTFDVDRDGARAPHLLAPGHDGEPSFAERAGGSARIAYAREAIASRFGPTISPMNAFLIGQGVETLSVRMRAHSAGAGAVAAWLEAHPAVESVDWVGLPSHKDHALAGELLSGGYGSVFTFTLRGGLEAARTVVNAVQLVTHMTHLGDVRTLLLHPATTSHVHSNEAEREAVGVFPGTLRISVGLEDPQDLINDLEQAFARL